MPINYDIYLKCLPHLMPHRSRITTCPVAPPELDCLDSEPAEPSIFNLCSWGTPHHLGEASSC